MIEKRYIFKANAIAAAARVHRIDPEKDLDHTVPSLAVSSLPVIGGESKAKVEHFCFEVKHPRPLGILSVHHAETHTDGKPDGRGGHRSTSRCRVNGLSVLSKVHVESLEAQLESEHTADAKHPLIRPRGNRIDGLKLDDYELKVTLDEGLFSECASKDQLAKRFASDSSLREKFAWRFNAEPKATSIPEFKNYYICSLVRDIQWVGKPHPDVTIEGYKLRWPGFGRIYLGEILVGEGSRRLTMIRVEMGSPIEGSASSGSVDQSGSSMP
jgi:hypothetical protein